MEKHGSCDLLCFGPRGYRPPALYFSYNFIMNADPNNGLDYWDFQLAQAMYEKEAKRVGEDLRRWDRVLIRYARRYGGDALLSMLKRRG